MKPLRRYPRNVDVPHLLPLVALWLRVPCCCVFFFKFITQDTLYGEPRRDFEIVAASIETLCHLTDKLGKAKVGDVVCSLGLKDCSHPRLCSHWQGINDRKLGQTFVKKILESEEIQDTSDATMHREQFKAKQRLMADWQAYHVEGRS